MDTSNRRYSCIVIAAEINPAQIIAHMVDSIRDGFTYIAVDEVVNVGSFRLALWLISRACVPIRPNQLLLLDVHRHNQQTPTKVILHTPIDVGKLLIAIQMIASGLMNKTACFEFVRPIQLRRM